jgi:hypothetical protein
MQGQPQARTSKEQQHLLQSDSHFYYYAHSSEWPIPPSGLNNSNYSHRDSLSDGVGEKDYIFPTSCMI